MQSRLQTVVQHLRSVVGIDVDSLPDGEFAPISNPIEIEITDAPIRLRN